MPIYLTTGSPGAGKTLSTLWDVENRRKAENRKVYQSGIADLLIDWTLFGQSDDPKRPHMTDPSEWYDLPEGSIIVIDECQRLFRPRALSKLVPKYVEMLETHRHKGFDIYLITQHPTLIETNVRKLVETHKHLMRKFGSKWATIHEWKGVKENCDKSRKDSIETQFRYPKEVFSWYKSAEVHTVKMKMPLRVAMLFAVPPVLIVAGYFAYTTLSGFGKPKPAAAPSSTSAPSIQAMSTSLPGASSVGKNAVSNDASFYTQWTPRFDGLAFSAPRYADLIAPVRVPVPVGCVYSGEVDSSFCVTQQGTLFKPPLSFIRDFATKGFFLDFEPGPALSDSRGGRPASSGFPPVQQAPVVASAVSVP